MLDEVSTSGENNNEASTLGSNNKSIETFQGKILNINSNLEIQKEQLIKMLQTHFDAFAWEYTDMRGILPNTCIHHIYIEDSCRPIRKLQKQMNPLLKEIVKNDLQKLLDVNFIYPISNSK
jgi:hypothetical protein